MQKLEAFKVKQARELQSDVATFVSLEVNFLINFCQIEITFFCTFPQEKKRAKERECLPESMHPGGYVVMGILDLDWYEKQLNFSFKENSENFIK